MAVVIQEMVAAESAGVLFTRDPISGNPSEMVITANYGLGEVRTAQNVAQPIFL
jgi:pyruvate,water dikinase